jgi:hypothetical protein
MKIAGEGSIDGVPYEIYDLSGIIREGVVPGFYYTAGEDFEEDASVALEGPFATKDEAIEAAQKFILDGLAELELETASNVVLFPSAATAPEDRLVTDTPIAKSAKA